VKKLALTCVVLLCACGSSGNASDARLGNTASSSSTSVCSARSALQTSFDALRAVDVRAAGADAVKAAADNINVAFDSFASAAGDKYENELNHARQAKDRLRAAISTLDTAAPGQGLTDVVTALTDFATAMQALQAKVSSDC
jgi:hypothetical protein